VAYTSEIEKLEKRWLENPKGRNFAPLADAYRKAGEVDRAIDLCKAGLERHPDYVSAHIVYARCLIDQKNDAGASEVFRKVLALDPENVLALKILADIAERGGRFDEAVEWFGRLLNADPMNGDAAEALARAKVKAAQAAAPEPVVRMVPAPVQTLSPMPAVPPAPPPPPPPQAAQADFVIEHASEGPTVPPLHVKGAPAGIETFDGTLDFNAVAHDAARADGLEVQEEVELKAQDLVVEGLAQSQYESALFAGPLEATGPDDELPTVDLPLIMPDDVGPPFAPPAPAAPAPTPPPAAVALSDDDGAADTAALSRAEPVLTETMAELYLRQGHQDDALRVYHALLAQRPGDARLRARVDALTGGGTGESVQAFLRRILAGRPGAPAAEPPPSGGSPLDGAFAATAVDAEPEPGIDAPGEATRLAADSISLDEVFGDEGVHSSLPAAEAPAGPAAEPAAAPPASGGFSFDQFFSPGPEAGAGGGSAGGSGAPPKAPNRTSGAKLLPPVEDEGDLDQFQSWLKGLKS
jgi:tetratricopeptide (TPR) repeat protein